MSLEWAYKHTWSHSRQYRLHNWNTCMIGFKSQSIFFFLLVSYFSCCRYIFIYWAYHFASHIFFCQTKRKFFVRSMLFTLNYGTANEKHTTKYLNTDLLYTESIHSFTSMKDRQAKLIYIEWAENKIVKQSWWQENNLIVIRMPVWRFLFVFVCILVGVSPKFSLIFVFPTISVCLLH